MKQNLRVVMVIAIAVVCIVVFGVAVLRSSTFTAPKKPAQTQAQIAQQLKAQSNSSKKNAKLMPSTGKASNTDQTSAGSITSTGPGEVGIIFLVSGLAGICSMQLYQRRNLRPLLHTRR